MTPSLTVRDVRQALLSQAAVGPGDPATLHLGRIFHEVFADLIGDDPGRNVRGALTPIGPNPESRRSALTRHAYDRLVAPRLDRDREALRGSTAALPMFWSAVEALCDWLVRLPDLDGASRVEESLRCRLESPTWSGPVELVGVADAVLRVSSGRWCVVELKLGRGAPEADLAQALLYHLMLRESEAGDGALSLVSFGPACSDRLFREADLEPAREALYDLIGRLAGVRREAAPPRVAAPPPPPPPPPPRTIPVPPAVAPAPTAPPNPDAEAIGAKLVRILGEYGTTVRLAGPPIVGPTFLRYTVVPGTGVTPQSVQGKAKSIQVRMGLDATPRIGIEGGRVVIDIQRPDRQTLDFAAIRGQFLSRVDRDGANAILPVGVAIDGRLVVADLSKPEHAHLLVAGTTGSGKSEWLRTAVAGLILANTPETLRLVVIDPKRNAFGWLRDSPFLLRPPVYPPDDSVVDVLEDLVEEMERRYRLMEASGSDTIADHARKTGEILPRIVCVCDEYADLVSGPRAEREAIENLIRRLGSKARASGIHLILATQQPSRKILSGALISNLPARVGLSMNSPIESKMLLEQSGAEALLGAGDLLFKDFGEPVRLQAPLLDESLREAIARGATV